MPSSPGAIAPGSTPATASNTVLKTLFSLQGLALVGAGAWLLAKRRKAKAARRNPSRRRRNPLTRADLYSNSAKLQKARNDLYAAYAKAWGSGKTKLSYGDWLNATAGRAAARRIEKRNPTDPRIRWVKIHDPKHLGWVAEIHQPGHTIQRFWGKTKEAALRKIEKAALKTNPSASWCRSMRKRRGAWLKRRFNRNPWSELDSGLPRGGAFPQDKAFKEMVAARVKSDLRRERISRIRDRQRRRGSKYGNLWANPRRRNPGPYLKIAGTKYDNDEAGWAQLAKDAPSFPRQELIRILVWNDRNGTYTDEDCKAERMDPMTKDEAVEAIRRVADDTYES